MKKRSKAATTSFYRKLVEQQVRSGKSVRELAAEQEIPQGTLSRWRHVFKKERELAVAPEERAPFLPVRVVEGSLPARDAWGYELELGGGRGVLRLPRDFDPVRAGAFVLAMEAAC